MCSGCIEDFNVSFFNWHLYNKKTPKKLTFTWLIASLKKYQTLTSSQMKPGYGLPLLSCGNTLGSGMEPPQRLQVIRSTFGGYSLQFTMHSPSQGFSRDLNLACPSFISRQKLSKISPP